MAIIAGGTTEQKAGLRDALLPRLDQASPLLREVAASCFSRSLAHDLVVDSDFGKLFRILQNDDARVRKPIIAELRDHIQRSDETARRCLVDADILSVILPAHSNQTKDDLLSFMTTVLPILGPSLLRATVDQPCSLYLLIRTLASVLQLLKHWRMLWILEMEMWKIWPKLASSGLSIH